MGGMQEEALFLLKDFGGGGNQGVIVQSQILPTGQLPPVSLKVEASLLSLL